MWTYYALMKYIRLGWYRLYAWHTEQYPRYNTGDRYYRVNTIQLFIIVISLMEYIKRKRNRPSQWHFASPTIEYRPPRSCYPQTVFRICTTRDGNNLIHSMTTPRTHIRYTDAPVRFMYRRGRAHVVPVTTWFTGNTMASFNLQQLLSLALLAVRPRYRSSSCLGEKKAE